MGIAHLGTPREAIEEMVKMRWGEEWFLRRMKNIMLHLEGVQFRGRPILDEPMSVSAIDAVLKEAFAAISKPQPLVMPPGAMLQ